MTKLLATICILLTFISCIQNKQVSDKDKERIDSVCNKFMQTFADGKTSEALQLLKQNSVMSPASIDTLEVTINKQKSTMLSAYGKILSSEFIVERKVKDFITKRFYVLKFDKYFLKFDFTLYKGSNGWLITNFNYDSDLIEILY
jgi:hypothetical protein